MGLEPTTPGITIRYSNQLSYAHHQTLARPTGLEPATAGLEGRCSIRLSYGRRLGERALVGAEGFEPPTSSSQSWRSTRLSYTPTLPTLGNAASRRLEMVRSPPYSVNRSRPVDFAYAGIRSGATRAKQARHGALADRLRQARPLLQPHRCALQTAHEPAPAWPQPRGVPSGCSQPDSPST